MRLRLNVPIALVPISLLLAATTPSAGATEPPETISVRTALRDMPLNRDTTREVHPASAFDLVGITWHGTAPETIEVRTRGAAGWSEWTTLEAISSTPGPQWSGTEPLWTGRADTAQVRAGRGGKDVTAELQLVTINPGTAPAEPARSSLPGRPPVVDRDQWGADESKMTWPPEPTETKAVTVHHTAGTNDYDCSESADIVRGIYHYHAVELNWGDVGYHALVDKCGEVFEGRTGGMRDDIIGGHVLGFNRHTFGVAMLGNHDEIAPSAATIESVAAISAWKLDTADVPADSDTELTADPAANSTFPPGAQAELPTIFAHRDVSKTACPGDLGYEQLDSIRARATALQRNQQP